jgi:hypothetical protein
MWFLALALVLAVLTYFVAEPTPAGETPASIKAGLFVLMFPIYVVGTCMLSFFLLRFGTALMRLNFALLTFRHEGGVTTFWKCAFALQPVRRQVTLIRDGAGGIVLCVVVLAATTRFAEAIGVFTST